MYIFFILHVIYSPTEIIDYTKYNKDCTILRCSSRPQSLSARPIAKALVELRQARLMPSSTCT